MNGAVLPVMAYVHRSQERNKALHRRNSPVRFPETDIFSKSFIGFATREQSSAQTEHPASSRKHLRLHEAGLMSEVQQHQAVYHMQEAGATATSKLAYTLRRWFGVRANGHQAEFGGGTLLALRLSFFWVSHENYYMEVRNFFPRRGPRAELIWARLIKQFNPKQAKEFVVADALVKRADGASRSRTFTTM